MHVIRNDPKPLPTPPPTFTVTLSEDEASAIQTVLLGLLPAGLPTGQLYTLLDDEGVWASNQDRSSIEARLINYFKKQGNA